MKNIPPTLPKNDSPGAPMRALSNDSSYDLYVGVMFFFRVVDAACQNTTQHSALGRTQDVFGAAGDYSKGAASTTSHTLTPSLSILPLSPPQDSPDTPRLRRSLTAMSQQSQEEDSAQFQDANV